MSVFVNLIIGFLASFVGVIPPGFLNMSAAKISMKEGRKKALLFSFGVATTVLAQTYIALLFARYLDKHPEIIDMLQKVGLGIFICITIYFFFIAKDTRRQLPSNFNKSKTNRFFTGIFVAFLNVLPLPYWVYISVTFSAFGWFHFSQPDILACVIGSALGTLSMLIVYIQFFRRKETNKPQRVNMNYVMGAITFTISAITFFKILQEV